MTEFILLLIIGVAWIWGVHCMFSDGYVFGPLHRNLAEIGLPKWISKPLFGCPPCMGSIHGFMISVIYYDFHIYLVMPYMVCLCGLNFIIKSILYPEYEDVSPD